MGSLSDSSGLTSIDEISASLEITADAWERFVNTGEFLEKEPRQVIAQSWLRCRERGINPHEERALSVISSEEIEAKLHTEYLGLSGKVVLDRMAHTIEDTGHVIVLADNYGRILYSVGNRQVQNRLEQINFRPGSNWGEKNVGPNGVGTPLMLGKPEFVMGSEHYCQAWQPWVCFGAPIYNPGDHSILGCVDITGPVEKAQSETMALAVSMTHSVEFNLSIVLLRRREILRSAFNNEQRQYPNDALIVLDETGLVIEANTYARNLLKLSSSIVIPDVLNQLYPDLSKNVNECLLHNIEKDCEISLNNSNIDIARCVIKPVNVRGERLGVFVIILGGRKVNKNSSSLSGKTPVANTAKYSFKNLIGESPAFKKSINVARLAAQDVMQNNVLLIGETGTGKELIAHSIHAEGKNNSGPFIAINCGALPKELIESELFGYSKGAFTGAKKEGQAGKFEAAHNGTLFLDEINSLDAELQAKLLRVLDEKSITRLGSVTETFINVRFIAAAGTDLFQAVEEGQFRRDLFHRLNVIEIFIPPVRERKNDLMLLFEYFLEQECAQAGRKKLEIAEEVKDKMLNYGWPGNIRELRNLCSRWVLTVSSREINLGDLPAVFQFPENGSNSINSNSTKLRSIEDELIRNTLVQTNGNISKTAKILGINRSTIYRRYNRWRTN